MTKILHGLLITIRIAIEVKNDAYKDYIRSCKRHNNYVHFEKDLTFEYDP